jgi:YegS/Rv2252/BmrU family lipid kinase
MAAPRNTLVLINRRCRALLVKEIAERDVSKTLKKAGIKAEVRIVDGGDIAALAQSVVDARRKLLIVGGGDGTISAAAGALAGSRTRLGILSLGTRNHFARDVGIPASLDESAQLIASGAERCVDVAELNGRVFVNNSAIGLYPLMVLDRQSQQKRLGRSKRLAMIVASVRTLARFNHQRLTLTINDQKARIDTPLLFVGNNDYKLGLPGTGKRERLDDGELCVMVLRKKTRRSFVAAAVRALVGRARRDDMVRLEGVERLRVGSLRSSLTVAVDGEVLRLQPPIDYRIRPRALRVAAP